MVEELWSGIRMQYSAGQFQLSTDSMVLADFCTLPPRSAVCDLGCGCGSLSLLLCGKYPQAQLTGMELQEEAAALAQENAVQNGLSDRLRILCGDLREHRTLLPHSSFDAVVSNPPYYPAGSGGVSDSPALAAARTERFCTLDDLCACAAWLLRSGGRFFVVHKPERLAELICALSRRRLEPKRLRLVRHQAGGSVSLQLTRTFVFTTQAEPKAQISAESIIIRRLDMAGTLYLVPTPIGNLGDISPRAKKTLAEADFIAAEDTRVSLKLLNHLELKKPLVSYYEHNKNESGPRIVERLLAGESCALVTDAGSPAISDPGEDLVALCAKAGVCVCAIPGPCAAVTALSVSGLPTGRFCFEGFLSTNKKSRREHLDSLKSERRTMIFYEAPHKLQNTLKDLTDAFGPERRISLCRELTKLHEQILRMTLGEALAYYTENDPRGEYVLILEGAAEASVEALTLEDAVSLALERIASGASKKDAVREVSRETGFPKNALYDAVLRMQDAD